MNLTQRKCWPQLLGRDLYTLRMSCMITVFLFTWGPWATLESQWFMVQSLEHEVPALSLEELETQPRGQSALCTWSSPRKHSGRQVLGELPYSATRQMWCCGELVLSVPDGQRAMGSSTFGMFWTLHHTRSPGLILICMLLLTQT